MITIAQFNSAVFVNLGEPDRAVCDPVMVHYAVRNAVFKFTRQLRAADTNQPLSLSAEFTPTTQSKDVTSVLGKGEIAWVERKVCERWVTVRCVNRVFLEQHYRNGVEAVSIRSDESNHTYIDFGDPKDAQSTQIYRYWYDADAVPVTHVDEAIALPDSLAPVVELSAANTVIPRIKAKLAATIEDEDGRKLIALKMQTLDGMFAQNQFELVNDWLPLFRRFKNRQRTSQNQSRLPNKSGGHLYGG